jgi:hypothetical protein
VAWLRLFAAAISPAWTREEKAPAMTPPPESYFAKVRFPFAGKVTSSSRTVGGRHGGA